MSFTYKHKKTGKIIKLEKPLTGAKKKDYILVSWIRNIMMKANQIMKK
jgi:hypothetical protein